jgi:hypothetical protein
MVVNLGSLKLQLFYPMATKPTNARIANRGISQSSKTHTLAASVLWVFLPTTNCWTGKTKQGTIGAKRAQEVLLGLRPEPTMPAKAVAIAPVVPIPIKQAYPTPICAKDAQKVNDGCFTLHTSCFNVKVNLNVTDIFSINLFSIVFFRNMEC